MSFTGSYIKFLKNESVKQTRTRFPSGGIVRKKFGKFPLNVKAGALAAYEITDILKLSTKDATPSVAPLLEAPIIPATVIQKNSKQLAIIIQVANKFCNKY